MFDKNEINVLIAALNSFHIKGADAAYVYSIQIKLKEESERQIKLEKEEEEKFNSGPPESLEKKEKIKK